MIDIVAGIMHLPLLTLVSLERLFQVDPQFSVIYELVLEKVRHEDALGNGGLGKSITRVTITAWLKKMRDREDRMRQLVLSASCLEP